MSTPIDVSNYYIDVAAKYMATNIVLTQRLKKESLNEIRNAFTHVARAHTLNGEGSDQSAKQEYEKALGHLQRVALDSAKDSIFELRRKCELAVKTLEGGNLVLPWRVHSELVRLLQARTSLSEEENSGPPTIVLVEKYGDLLGEYYDFYRKIDADFQVDAVTRRIRLRRFWTLIGFILSFVTGIIASYVANRLPDLPWF